MNQRQRAQYLSWAVRQASYWRGSLTGSGDPDYLEGFDEMIAKCRQAVKELRVEASQSGPEFEKVATILDTSLFEDPSVLRFHLLDGKKFRKIPAGTDLYIKVSEDSGVSPEDPSKKEVSMEFLLAVAELLFQIEIGTFVDEHGHKAQMLKAYQDVRRTRPI